MSIFICSYCGSERKSKKSLTGHETFCKLNPNHKAQNTATARLKSLERISCKWCNEKHTTGNIKKHEKSCNFNPESNNRKLCPVCNKEFFGKSTTCSHSCSNTYFRHASKGGQKFKTDDQLAKADRYRDLCFRHHKKECIICGESNIVTVHHINEDHFDHRPENLVPLCPTHHQYWHSNYKYLVDKSIKAYILEWKQQLSVGKSG